MKRLQQYAILGLLLLLICMLAACQPCPPCPPCPPTATPAATCAPTATVEPTATPVPHPTIAWDARLNTLNARIEIVAGARYQLIAAWSTHNGSWDDTPRTFWTWIDATGGGGDRHMFVRVEDMNGAPVVGKRVIFGWPGTDTELQTDAAGWANGVCQAVYYPDQEQAGPYALQPLKGDKLMGGGLPYGEHWSVFGVWRERANYQPMILEWLGIVR